MSRVTRFLVSCGLLAVIALGLYALGRRREARSESPLAPPGQAQGTESADIRTPGVRNVDLHVVGSVSFDDTTLQRPVDLALAADGSPLVLDNQGAIFEVSRMGTPAPLVQLLRLAQPLDTPTSLSAEGHRIAIADRLGVTVITRATPDSTTVSDMSFDTLSRVALTSSELATIGTDTGGRNRLRLPESYAHLTHDADTWLKSVGSVGVLLTSCGSDALVLGSRSAAEVVVLRKSAPRAAIVPVVPASHGSSRDGATRGARLLAAIACDGSMLTILHSEASLTVSLVDLATATPTRVALRAPVVHRGWSAVAISLTRSRLYGLYRTGDAAGGLVMLALPSV